MQVALVPGSYNICFSRTDRNNKRISLSLSVLTKEKVSKPLNTQSLEVLEWSLNKLQESMGYVSDQLYESSERATTHSEMVITSRAY